jgi:hypothetical protein
MNRHQNWFDVTGQQIRNGSTNDEDGEVLEKEEIRMRAIKRAARRRKAGKLPESPKRRPRPVETSDEPPPF